MLAMGLNLTLVDVASSEKFEMKKRKNNTSWLRAKNHYTEVKAPSSLEFLISVRASI